MKTMKFEISESEPWGHRGQKMNMLGVVHTCAGLGVLEQLQYVTPWISLKAKVSQWLFCYELNPWRKCTLDDKFSCMALEVDGDLTLAWTDSHPPRHTPETSSDDIGLGLNVNWKCFTVFAFISQCFLIYLMWFMWFFYVQFL